MILKELYSHIGKLLYSISEIDGVISDKEKERLHQLVKDKLVDSESSRDVFGTNVAWIAEIEFDYLDDTQANPEYTFASFIDFLKFHRSAITPDLKNLMINLAKEIANAYRKSNKKEKELLHELLLIMKTI